MSVLFVALLVAAVVVLIGAEWPRLAIRLGVQGRERRPARDRRPRRRSRRRADLRVVPSESDDFVASVHRDLANLPTTRERDKKRP